MSNLRTAAQQALEALKQRAIWSPLSGAEDAAMTALRAALAEPMAEAQEPVECIDALKDAFFEGFTSVATYNDTLLNSPEEAWEKYRPPRIALRQAEPVQKSPDLNCSYHPCTSILIKALKEMKAYKVLAEWDKARAIVDARANKN